MNQVNIYREYQDFRIRKNLSNTDIAIACGISKQAVGEWKNEKPLIKNSYLERIAHCYGDERFMLAAFCYRHEIPSSFLTILNRYNDNPLAMLVGTQSEDAESDEAIQSLLNYLSKPKDTIKKDDLAVPVIEMLETGAFMFLSAMRVLKDQNIKVNQVWR